MVVNAYFGPGRTNIPHEKPNYRPGKYNFKIDYYRHRILFYRKTG